MPDLLMQASSPLLANALVNALLAIKPWLLIFLGFSAVIFVHELGHFLVAKWAGVRVEKFCVGFGRELVGFTRGETRYGFNILPLGGYVKMLGQEDFEIDATGELQHTDDPRSFANKPVGHRMLIVSAGVVMNVVFAAFLFMIVFMVGMDVLVTEVGLVKPNSPAALGGLQVGDQVMSINGKRTHEFSEIQMAIMLSEPFEPLDFVVERNGQTRHLKLLPENNSQKRLLEVGMGPAVTREVAVGPPGANPDREDVPRPGDMIVEVNGRQITDQNANQTFYRMIDDPGQPLDVVVERPENPDDPESPTRRVTVQVQPRLELNPSDLADPNSINVLGLSPLMRFDSVEPGGRAYAAGIEPGDTIVRVGDARYPTRLQIHKAILEACTVRRGPDKEDYDYQERDIPFVVQRPDGTLFETVLRPRVKTKLFGRNGRPDINATYDLIAADLLRVGEVVPEIDGRPSPAVAAGIPAGAVIETVDDVEVSTWIDLIEQLRHFAGQAVTLGYTTAEGQPAAGRMIVPHSLRTRLGLPVASRIEAIDGVETATFKHNGRSINASVSSWIGLSTRLKECVGQTVTVRYREGIGLAGEPQTAQVEVSEDMVDPWLGRIAYQPNLLTYQARKTLRTSNPVEAVAIGAKKTWYFIVNVYMTIKRMVFTRSVGVEHLSGPVGIVKLGSDFAHAGLNQLIFFLAMISANLAVINFLPLPIVDGGLMVFLIIEKIKGSPVSIKIQVATQVIGLFLIIAAFLAVTYQDLQRLFG